MTSKKATTKKASAPAKELTGSDITGASSSSSNSSSGGAKKGGKRANGMLANGEPDPTFDVESGERRSVTYKGLQEEFGVKNGTRLYNDIAVAAFGGVQPGRPDLSLKTLEDQYARAQNPDETDEEFERVLAKRVERRDKVNQLLADAKPDSE